MARIPLWRRLLQFVIPRTMIPRDPETAEKIRMGLAMAYGLIGWHLAGLMFYDRIKDPPTDPEKRKTYYQSLSPGTEMKIIRMRGLTIVNEDDEPKQETIAETEIEENPTNSLLTIS